VEFLELLKPPAATDPSEICKCSGDKPVKLMCALSYNPIHCIDCNLEVAPTRLPITSGIVRSVANWCWLYSAIDRLWLASGDYEEWAKAELSDIHSSVNRLGLSARSDVDSVRRCYYWLFQDQSVDEFESIEICPICSLAFTRYDEGIYPQLKCEGCSLITVA